MPRHLRPPATAREIGAYLAGGRVAALFYDSPEPTAADRRWQLARLAGEDVELLVAMDPVRFWAYFDMGWVHELERKALQ